MMKQLFGATLFATVAFGSLAAQAADADSGKNVFKQCIACHTIEAGKNKIGPSLFGIVDRPAASIEGFKYSKPMSEKAAGGLVWNTENLDIYLKQPKAFVPGGTMAFAGVKDDAKRADLLAYLATLK